MDYKKLVKGGLAALMALSMTACGNSGSSEGSGSSTEGGAGAIKLGASGPITGNAAVYGLAVQHAAEIAIEEVNALGGTQIEMNFQDDQADGEKAVSAYNALMDWGMQISLGTVTSGSGQAVAPNYAQDNIFAITPSGSSTAIIYRDATNNTDPYGVMFQMCFTDPNQGTASADYLKAHSELGSKIGIIYRSDDNYSTGIYNTFKAEADKLGLTIVDTETFVDSDTDYSVQVKKLADAGADIVFLPIYYQPASQILVEANKQGYTPKFFGCDGMDGILTLENFDKSLAEGVMLLTPFVADASDDLTKNFVTEYQKRQGEVPNQFAADAYDCVFAIYNAVEKAEIKPGMSAKDTCEKLISVFTSADFKFDGLTGESVTWSASGEVSKKPKGMVIQNGVYVGMD